MTEEKKYTETEIEKIRYEWYERGVIDGKTSLLRSLHELLRTDEMLEMHEERYHAWDKKSEK